MNVGRALVIDDDGEMRHLIETLLGSGGIECHLEASGEDAVPRLYEEVYDLIIVDVMMNGMNGIEFIAQVKKSPKNRRSTIIVVSGVVEDHALNRALNLGEKIFSI